MRQQICYPCRAQQFLNNQSIHDGQQSLFWTLERALKAIDKEMDKEENKLRRKLTKQDPPVNPRNEFQVEDLYFST